MATLRFNVPKDKLTSKTKKLVSTNKKYRIFLYLFMVSIIINAVLLVYIAKHMN